MQLLCGVRMLAYGEGGARPDSGTAPKQVTASPPVVDARDLPMDQYVRLRALALSGASMRLGPRIKNPRVGEHGLEPAVSAILEQQREYRRTHVTQVTSAFPQARRNAAQQESLLAEPERVPGGPRSSMLGAGLQRAILPVSLCSNPTIAVVNGRAATVVFTPQRPDNHYRIEGCGFGAVPGEVRLEPEPRAIAVGVRAISLQPDQPGSWTQNGIDVHLDPRLSGVPDFAVTLVLQRADGERAELPGCRFIAARGEPVPLKTIAASWVKLDATMATSYPIRQLEFVSPPVQGDEVPRNAGGMSSFVVRSDPNAFREGTDFYDFSKLNPGWSVESMQIQNYLTPCPGDVTHVGHSGAWDATFDAHGFTVAWASDSCFSFIPPVVRFRMSSSEYALKVWVVGPLGTEPVRADFSQYNRKNNQATE
jgi:hypothetical protein